MVIQCVSAGKPADDDIKLGLLKLKPNTKIMMMGSREESLVGLLTPCMMEKKVKRAGELDYRRGTAWMIFFHLICSSQGEKNIGSSNYRFVVVFVWGFFHAKVQNFLFAYIFINVFLGLCVFKKKIF